jgi:immune inhibitor A
VLKYKEKGKVKKLIAMVIIAVLFSSAFLVLSRPTIASAPETEPTAIDVANAPRLPVQNDLGTLEPRSHHSAWNVGDVAYWLVYDSWYGRYRVDTFKLRAIGPNTEIWVQMDLSWGRAPAAPDPRVPNPPIILDSEIAYLLDQMENVIYPTDTHYFGMPAVRDGSYAQLPGLLGLPADYYAEGNNKNIVLVENIRDQNYYQPTYPYYIAGVFSSTLSNVYFDRNVISIDCYRWEYRLGPAGTEWIPGYIVNRPFVYESTIAHEYQHLIHADWNPGDDTFMNEGCSMYAEYLCGYGIDPSYLNSYFYTPDNSLTIWGDQGDINILADYGVAALWVMYLSDHYGGAATISYFVDNGIGGIDGVNVALAHFGYKQGFDGVFHDWRLANLLRQASGPYSYTNINLNDPSIIPIFTHNVNGFPVPWTTGTSFGNTITDLGYDTGVATVYGYGSDYITFTNWDRPGFIAFNGDDTALVPGWTMTADGWWSGTGVDLQNALLAGSVTVSMSDPTLTIVTAYGIESFWDFGFVQVSTDGGNTWTSLANGYTTSDHDPSAHPAIIANLPGLTDYNPDWPSWTTMSFDLTAYAGQTVMIGFRYMTDWSTTYEGWWINSATVGSTALTLAPIYPKASYDVTAIMALSCGKSGKFNYIPYDVSLDANTWTGEHNTFAKNPTYIVLVVSPTMHMGTVDYQFRVYKK